MDYQGTKILNSDIDIFFGGQNDHTSNFPVLEATLRYIALKHCENDITKIKPIKVYASTFDGDDRGNSFADFDNDFTIGIFAARNSAEPLHVDVDGWISMETPPFPVAPFLSKASSTTLFLNKEKEKVLIFVKRTTSNWIDELSSSLFRVLPWIYKDDSDISIEEKSFFKAIHEKNSQVFTDLINKLCDKYDFRSLAMKKTLFGWNNAFRESQIQLLEKNTETIRQEIQKYSQQVSLKYDELAAIHFNLNNLLVTKENDDDELYDFFLNRKQLGIYRVEANTRSKGKTLWYTILETIDFYDKDAFLRIFENKTSCFSQYDNNIRKIFYSIFAEEKGKFRTECMFALNNLSSLSPLKGTSGKNDSIVLPHPHIANYACLGGNELEIHKYMQVGEWGCAIDQSIVAAKNLNMGDYTVLNSMIQNVSRVMKDHKCIIADNNVEMTPSEFLDYISKTEPEVTQNG